MPYLNFNFTRPAVKFFITIVAIIAIGSIVSYTGLLLSRIIFWLHLDQVNDVLYNRYDLLSNAQLRYYQAISTISFFILPGLFLHWLFSSASKPYFEMKEKPRVYASFLILITLILAMPLINWLYIKNQFFTLPGFLSGLEESLQKMDQEHTDLIERMTLGNGLVQFSINLIVIAFLPAIGEELIFRGVLQKIIIDWIRKRHLGIILTALIFSAIHGQFYGFLPRFTLGVFFGYLIVWGRSIWYPIIAHFLYNTFMLTLTYMQVHGNKIKLLPDNNSLYYFPFNMILLIGSTLLAVAAIYLLRKSLLSKMFQQSTPLEG